MISANTILLVDIGRQEGTRIAWPGGITIRQQGLSVADAGGPSAGSGAEVTQLVKLGQSPVHYQQRLSVPAQGSRSADDWVGQRRPRRLQKIDG